jgi:exopolyphosphatase/guanosine-5'-triphosphate,3'-diphosphate pyrophosphatase
MAAIDMGTNATRVAIGIVSPENGLEIIHTHRYPLRFGNDVFCNGNITSSQIEDSLGIFNNIKKTFVSRNAAKIRAVATSALREAKNSKTLIERIKKETGISIEVISGLEEAHLLSWAICQKLDLSYDTHMIADLGAGSLELVKIKNSKPIWMESFTISAVSYAGMDNNILEKIIPTHLEQSLSIANDQLSGVDSFIASGGNIEVLGRILESKVDNQGIRSINTFSLEVFINQCKKMTIEEIRYYFGLPMERAEVIGSSAQIYLWLARKMKVDEIIIPMIGLKEAILMDMVYALNKQE